MREDIKASLDRYAQSGVPTGGFLRAVLANDLMDAMGRAYSENKYAIHEIASYVYNELPAECHGSYEKVDAWIKKKLEERKVGT